MPFADSQCGSSVLRRSGCRSGNSHQSGLQALARLRFLLIQKCVSIGERVFDADLLRQRALEFGEVETGDAISVVVRPNPEWTIARANEIIYADPRVLADMLALRNVPLLSAEWRGTLDNRIERLSGGL